MRRLLLAAVLLAPALASAARYDPDPDRAALRQNATVAHSTVVDATGLALEPEKVPAITSGLDEGLRLARLAAAAAVSLDDAARLRGLEMEAGAKAVDRRLKDATDAVAEETGRRDRLASEHAELKQKVEDLPPEEKEKLKPLLAKAAGALRSADDALRPSEEAAKLMGEQAGAMKSARREAAAPLVEISSAAAGVIRRAGDLPPAMADAKERLAALGREPLNVSRSRAWEKLDLLRDLARLLFEAADRACNRADDFRRLSASYEKASGAFEKARLAAASGPAEAKPHLDAARKALAQVRESVKK